MMFVDKGLEMLFSCPNPVSWIQSNKTFLHINAVRYVKKYYLTMSNSTPSWKICMEVADPLSSVLWSMSFIFGNTYISIIRYLGDKTKIYIQSSSMFIYSIRIYTKSLYKIFPLFLRQVLVYLRLALNLMILFTWSFLLCLPKFLGLHTCTSISGLYDGSRAWIYSSMHDRQAV